MSIAFFGQGMTNLGWTVISDVAPKKLIGLTGGIFNFSANLAGIVTPLVIGIAFQMTGSFVGPLVYIAVVALHRRVRVQRDPRRHPPPGRRDELRSSLQRLKDYRRKEEGGLYRSRNVSSLLASSCKKSSLATTRLPRLQYCG